MTKIASSEGQLLVRWLSSASTDMTFVPNAILAHVRPEFPWMTSGSESFTIPLDTGALPLEIDSSDRQLIVRALALQSILAPGFHEADQRVASLLGMEGYYNDFLRMLRDREEVRLLQSIDKSSKFKIGTRVRWLQDEGDADEDLDDTDYWYGEVTSIPERVDGLYSVSDEDGDDWDLYGWQLEVTRG